MNTAKLTEVTTAIGELAAAKALAQAARKIPGTPATKAIVTAAILSAAAGAYAFKRIKAKRAEAAQGEHVDGETDLEGFASSESEATSSAAKRGRASKAAKDSAPHAGETDSFGKPASANPT